jgi:hypothetical protein
MDHATRLRQAGGALLALGGVAFFLAGAVHPQGSNGSFAEATAGMLASPTWSAAHWLAVASALAVVWALWLLLDSGWLADSLVGQAGARLVLVAGPFMAVEFAAELAARPEAAAYAAGAPTPMGALVEAMQAVGWPAFMLGFVLLIAGLPSSAPAVVRLAGAVGALAMGLGGLLTEGLHLPAAGPLFIGGNLLAVWLVWSGVAAVRRGWASANTARRSERGASALTA